MADGDGYKIWQDNEQVDADEFQGYMQRQVVSSHIDMSARDTAITAVPEGHIAVARDTDELEIGDVGDTWVPFGRYGEWGTYTPSLDGATTNPTLGTGSVQTGRFFRMGTLAVVHVYIGFGTSSVSGSGAYEVTLPSACPPSTALFTGEEIVVGHGISDIGGTTYTISARPISATKIRFTSEGTTGDVDATNPAAYGDEDVFFSGTLTYETEPGAP